MRCITKFLIVCLKCADKSLVNIEFNQKAYMATFHCFNCDEKQVLLLEGTEPPMDKEDFKNKSRPLKKNID